MKADAYAFTYFCIQTSRERQREKTGTEKTTYLTITNLVNLKKIALKKEAEISLWQVLKPM